jgi:hypothetical protein
MHREPVFYLLGRRRVDLNTLLEKCGLRGEWRQCDPRSRHWQYRVGRVAINLWEGTGTVTVQGPHRASKEIEAVLGRAGKPLLRMCLRFDRRRYRLEANGQTDVW